jgi:hypothetical protein
MVRLQLRNYEGTRRVATLTLSHLEMNKLIQIKSVPKNHKNCKKRAVFFSNSKFEKLLKLFSYTSYKVLSPNLEFLQYSFIYSATWLFLGMF